MTSAQTDEDGPPPIRPARAAISPQERDANALIGILASGLPRFGERHVRLLREVRSHPERHPDLYARFEREIPGWRSLPMTDLAIGTGIRHGRTPVEWDRDWLQIAASSDLEKHRTAAANWFKQLRSDRWQRIVRDCDLSSIFGASIPGWPKSIQRRGFFVGSTPLPHADSVYFAAAQSGHLLELVGADEWWAAQRHRADEPQRQRVERDHVLPGWRSMDMRDYLQTQAERRFIEQSLETKWAIYLADSAPEELFAALQDSSLWLPAIADGAVDRFDLVDARLEVMRWCSGDLPSDLLRLLDLLAPRWREEHDGALESWHRAVDAAITTIPELILAASAGQLTRRADADALLRTLRTAREQKLLPRGTVRRLNAGIPGWQHSDAVTLDLARLGIGIDQPAPAEKAAGSKRATARPGITQGDKRTTPKTRGAVRRLRSLVAIGYDPDDLARAAGVSANAVWWAILVPPTEIHVGLDERVRELYSRLSGVPLHADPNGAEPERRANRSRQLAARLGWRGPLDWQNIDLDSERAAPSILDVEAQAILEEIRRSTERRVAGFRERRMTAEPSGDEPGLQAPQRSDHTEELRQSRAEVAALKRRIRSHENTIDRLRSSRDARRVDALERWAAKGRTPNDAWSDPDYVFKLEGRLARAEARIVSLKAELGHEDPNPAAPAFPSDSEA